MFQNHYPRFTGALFYHFRKPLTPHRFGGFGLRLGDSPAFKDLLGDRIGPTDADLESDDALDAWLMREATTGQHISGTCKMGPSSDPLAVVDQHGRVYGLEGLRVVDASIMPDCIRANTNVTTMMIGERVADFIRQGG